MGRPVYANSYRARGVHQSQHSYEPFIICLPQILPFLIFCKGCILGITLWWHRPSSSPSCVVPIGPSMIGQYIKVKPCAKHCALRGVFSNHYSSVPRDVRSVHPIFHQKTFSRSTRIRYFRSRNLYRVALATPPGESRVRLVLVMTGEANDGAGAVDVGCDYRHAVRPTKLSAKVIRGIL